MSKTKRFAIWLSACVYQWEFTNEEILERFLQREDIDKPKDVKHWLLTQIDFVRNEPDRFRDLMSINQGRGF